MALLCHLLQQEKKNVGGERETERKRAWELISTTCFPRSSKFSLGSAHSAQTIPATQMFLVEKKLLIIDQRNVAPSQEIQRSGEEARAGLNEKSEMNYASLSHIHLFLIMWSHLSGN